MDVIWMFDPPCHSLWDWREVVLWGLLISDDIGKSIAWTSLTLPRYC